MWPLIAAGALMVAVVGAGTFWRYVLDSPLLWTEELARYLMIWIGLLGASISMRRGEHMRVDFLVKSLPKKIQLAADLLVALAICYFLYILTVQGGSMVVNSWTQVSPALGIPMSWPLASVPLSGGLMLVQLLLRMAITITDVVTGREDPPGIFDWEPERL